MRPRLLGASLAAGLLLCAATALSGCAGQAVRRAGSGPIVEDVVEQVPDGRTLVLHHQTVRLAGIAICNGEGCAERARARLSALALGRSVLCLVRRREADGTGLGICRVRDQDPARVLVEEGLAVPLAPEPRADDPTGAGR